MTCQACTTAEKEPLTGLYVSGCKACSARALAQGIEHAKARMLGKMTPEYVASLRAVFGEEWEAGHREVKAWAKRIDAARVAA